MFSKHILSQSYFKICTIFIKFLKNKHKCWIIKLLKTLDFFGNRNLEIINILF